MKEYFRTTLFALICLLQAPAAVTAMQTGTPAQWPPWEVYARGAYLPFDRMVDALARADVVVIGEEHTNEPGHAMELKILQALYARRPDMALSMEMFERDVQLVLDEYLAGDISKQSFLAEARPWPNYATDYAPLVEFCKRRQLPVVAANVPHRYVSLVAAKGQQALLKLPRMSRRFLPKLPYSQTIPPGYDQALTAIFANHGAPGGATAGEGPPHMKQAQELWDATMADSVAQATRRLHGRLIMQLNGAMHSDSGWGLVDRLRRQMPRLHVVTISIRPVSSWSKANTASDATVADFVVYTITTGPFTHT
ncbi:MAG: ChaN family lipoprotein [Armatimonadetes bacterium]|nr:ChaN family lipoprotein [Armatimonadota bacterium]MDE2206039.1 ChaN family lipoprotein [Armatimonadota bacterium]